MIPVDDVVMLRKLLAMTTSTSDGEALTAIRKANNILTKHKITWQDIAMTLKPAVAERPAYQSRNPPPPKTFAGDEIEEAFDAVLASKMSMGFRTLIESIYNQWQGSNGHLSERQYQVLMDAKRNIRR